MTETYECYPKNMVLIYNLFNLAVYAIGALILFGFGWIISLLYLAYCLIIEISVYKQGCVNCYYYGKCCFSGKGKIAAKLFKKGDPKKFERDVSWIEFLPVFLVGILPMLGGAILLIMNFDWMLLVVVGLYVPFYFMGQAAVHGWGCKHCKQGKICCPASEFFEKKTKK